MERIKVGITGNHGFIGSHLTNYFRLKTDLEVIPFEKEYFNNEKQLDAFVKQCHSIVHLAAMNRHQDGQVIYNTNLSLVDKLIKACERTKSRPHILFSSSTQEERDNLYGKSKSEGRLLLEDWAEKQNAKVTGLIIPNVFGPFGKPFYNSVVATFCYQLANNEQPKVDNDAEIGLIYVNELVEKIYSFIKGGLDPEYKNKNKAVILPSKQIKVSEILKLLQSYKERYLDNSIFPDLTDPFEKALFNTFRCYIPANYYPHHFKLNKDNRGVFVEIARTLTPGQTSFSTTLPGITRGNHYHTRKAERFAVIKGKARIQLRRIGTTEVINYFLDGEKPSYVDMPIWHTHNITNIGGEELLTLFWINEPFDPNDPDTYFEEV